MLDILQIIIFGAVQGFTEFLPVSSSGHLAVMHQFWPTGVDDSLSFDVALHLGTLGALIIYFKTDLAKLIKNLFVFGPNEEKRVLGTIFVAITPAIIAALLFEKFFSSLRSADVVAYALIIGALMFLLVEKFSKSTKLESNLDNKSALVVGLFQVLSLIPGFSRSGMTIVGAMSMGFSRETSARFSFLMSIPLIFLAGIKKSYDIYQTGWENFDLTPIFIGTLSSFVFGYLAIKYFMKFVKKFSLNWFAVYRIILALIILILL